MKMVVQNLAIIQKIPLAVSLEKVQRFVKETEYDILLIEYCPNGENDEEAKMFYSNLVEELRPSKVVTFLNTKLFYYFTVFDLSEFILLMDACLIAFHRNLKDNNNWSLFGFFIAYTICYSLYYLFFKRYV